MSTKKRKKTINSCCFFWSYLPLGEFFSRQQPSLEVAFRCFEFRQILAQLLVAFGSCMFRRSVRTPQVFWVEMVPTKYVSQKKTYEIWVYIYMHIYIYLYLYIYIYIFIYAYVAFRMDENPVSNETVKMGWASIWSWAGFLWWWNMIKWLKSDEFLIFPKEWSIQCLMETKRATKNLMESPLKSWAKRHFRMLKH